MKFTVVFRDGTVSRTTSYPYVVLTQDNWDDYGYKSTFDAVLHLSSVEKVELHSVKILSSKQDHGYTIIPKEPFRELPDSHYSLGADLEYYENLFKCGPEVYEPFLRGIRDVAFDDQIKARVEDLEGYRVSLLRFSGAERTIEDANRLFKRQAPVARRRGSGFKVGFKTSVASTANSVVLDFDFSKHKSLPHRVNALIGYNGTGKTRLLSNLAIVASGYGYAEKVDVINQTAGRFVNTQPPFKTVVVVSYSAFDSFVIPGKNDAEKARLQSEGELFGYVYCGLRERIDSDSKAGYRLKTLAEIEDDFLQALDRVDRLDRKDLYVEILKPLLKDASFQRVGLSPVLGDMSTDEVTSHFRGMSSGHKVVLKIVTELTAHLSGSQPTLVLIDEPETHLHPPLLAAFLQSIRLCLEHFDGYAVIATHSPVVLQETASRYVHILRRIGERSEVVPSSIETFGEGIGVLTQQVFNLDDGTTDWHETLKDLASKHSLDELTEIFGRELGFAARSYVINTQNDEI